MKRKCRVCAIIVTFNPDITVLNNQFDSINNQVDFLIYIDNGSINRDLVKFFLQTKDSKRFVYIQNENNIGLGAAQNQGIKFAFKEQFTHVLFLDHDSVLFPEFVNKLLECENELATENLKFGAIGPVYVNKATGESYPITKYLGPFIKRIDPKNMKKYVEASFIISSGSLINMDVLSKIGMMDENLFVDYIDVEWSFRSKSLGYPVFVSPNAIMHHNIGDNRMNFFGRKISVHSPTRRYYLTRNSLYMLRLPYVDLGYKIREIFFNFLRIVVFTTISNSRFNYFKLSLKGIRDGILGNFGQIDTFKKKKFK